MMARRFFVSLMLVVAAFFVLASPLSTEARGGQYTVYLPVVQHAHCSWCAVPMLLAPPDGSTVDTLTPEFHWDSGDDPQATRGWLRVASDASFTEVVAMAYSRSWAQGVHQYQFGLIDFDPGTTYWWRVQLQYSDIVGPPSPAWTFTTP